MPQLIEMLGAEMADEAKASVLKKGFDGLSAQSVATGNGGFF
ncbi:MAG: hypothetical protein U5R30_09525 [Deltaproteobacteria bacterium]|nr:hypothetical protein [Deltaproteobacteria bacterium]